MLTILVIKVKFEKGHSFLFTEIIVSRYFS